jgi:hypothetical protein
MFCLETRKINEALPKDYAELKGSRPKQVSGLTSYRQLRVIAVGYGALRQTHHTC